MTGGIVSKSASATRRRVVAVLAGIAGLAVVLGAACPAVAVDQSKGYAGFCKSDVGVTVVVDFGKLGGTPLVRCFPSAQAGSGLDALRGAGFQIDGVQRWGDSFICRIENRPSATEKLPLKNDADYREACVDTPPSTAYWAYWQAGNNCAWTYSKWGAKNDTFVQGGFEGWTFSLNESANANLEPRIAAVRPGTRGQACGAAAAAGPSSNDLDENQQASSGASTPASPGSNSAESSLPGPLPRTAATSSPSDANDRAADPRDNVKYSGGQNAPDVRRQPSAGASRWAPWAAAVGVLGLVAATGLTSRRRRRTRGGG